MRIAAAAAQMIRQRTGDYPGFRHNDHGHRQGVPRNFKSLTIITNATNIAAELADTPVEVILTGGVLSKNSFSLVGPLAEETLQQGECGSLFLAWMDLMCATV